GRHVGEPARSRPQDPRRAARPGRAPRLEKPRPRGGEQVKPSVGVIVAAAGSGSRLGRGSKALVRLHGRTTLARVVEIFLGMDEIDRIVVVGPPSRLENAEHEVASLHPTKPVTV